MHRVLASRASRRLGEASLGIYLLHVPVYSWMVHVAPDVPAWGPAPSAVFYAVFLGLTVVLGLGLERALERIIRHPKPVPVPAITVEPAARRVQPLAG